MLLKIGAAVAAFFGYHLIKDAIKTKQAGDKLISEIEGIVWKGIKNSNINIDLNFKHTNATNKDLKFDFIFLDIMAGESKIASIREQSLNKLVAKNGVTEHTIPLKISLLSLALPIIKIITSGKLPEKVKVTGNIKVNDYITTYNEEYPLKKA